MKETELPDKEPIAPVAPGAVHNPLGCNGMDGSAEAKEKQRKKDILNQLSFEVEKGKGFLWGWDIAVYKCKGKIVKYGEMAVAKCIVSFPHTILVERETWRLLTCLTILCFATMIISIVTGSAESMGMSNVTGRVQLLLGFVLSGHVGQVLNRWSQLRFNFFGPMWGGIENFCMLLDQAFVNDESDIAQEIKSRSKRYCRLIMRLLFAAVREQDHLDQLQEEGLLTQGEQEWLQVCTLGTRSLVVFGWLSRMWEDIKAANLISQFNALIAGDNALLGIKGGYGGTMGMLGCPLPYSYVHVVYWTVQMLLSVLAVETGTMLAIFTKRSGNGNGEYSYDDGTNEWPENSNVWYLNEFIQVTCGNVIFALFTVGLLKVCDKLSNPFRDLETSFPDFLYDKALHNNMNAVATGLNGYSEIYPNRYPPKPPSYSQNGLVRKALEQLVLPSNVAIWSAEQVAAWVGRNNDDAYRNTRTDSQKGGRVDMAYYRESPAIYQYCMQRFLDRKVTGNVLSTLTEDDLENDFGMNDKYLRRAFFSDLKNLAIQLA